MADVMREDCVKTLTMENGNLREKTPWEDESLGQSQYCGDHESKFESHLEQNY